MSACSQELLLYAWTGWDAVERSHSGPDRHDRPVRVPSRPGGATTCTTLPRLTTLAGLSALWRGLGTRRRADEVCAWPSCAPRTRVASLRASRMTCALSRALTRRATGGWSTAHTVTSSDAVGTGPSARIPPQDQQPRRRAARLASESSVGPLVSNLLFVCLFGHVEQPLDFLLFGGEGGAQAHTVGHAAPAALLKIPSCTRPLDRLRATLAAPASSASADAAARGRGSDTASTRTASRPAYHGTRR